MSLDACLAGCLTLELERMYCFIPICNIELFFNIYQVFGKGASMDGSQFVVLEGICSCHEMGMQCLLTLEYVSISVFQKCKTMFI